MHQFYKAIEKRLRALEQRLGAAPTTETPDQTNRRAELVRAAVTGFEPANLTATERVTFSKLVRDVPLLFELRDEGALDGFLGEGHRDEDHREARHEDSDGDAHEDGDEDEDGDDFGELTWMS